MNIKRFMHKKFNLIKKTEHVSVGHKMFHNGSKSKFVELSTGIDMYLSQNYDKLIFCSFTIACIFLKLFS